jgi:hypothetical protein
MTRGGGSAEHYNFNFIVTPTLPDDLTGLDLAFKEYSNHNMNKPAGFEFLIHL